MFIKDVESMREWAGEFAKTLRPPVAVALHGDLGMGKSEIARAIIKELCGPDTIVPSPTFTLVQSYDVNNFRISHFDLYRISDPAELEEIGLSHACANDITLVEWPEIATHILPPDSVHVYIEQEKEGRKLLVRQQ